MKMTLKIIILKLLRFNEVVGEFQLKKYFVSYR